MLATTYIADKERMGDADFVATSRIADDLSIPTPSLARILRLLAGAGIIETKEGSRGGVRLGREPAAISLADIVRAVDASPVFRTDAETKVSGPIPRKRTTALRRALASAEGELHHRLEEVTIADITGN